MHQDDFVLGLKSTRPVFALPCFIACRFSALTSHSASYLPLCCLQSNELVPYTVTVQSDLVVCLSLSRRAFMQLMGHGPAVTGLSSEDAASAGATLMGTPQLKGLSDSEFKAGIWADVVGCVSSRTTVGAVWGCTDVGTSFLMANQQPQLRGRCRRMGYADGLAPA